ncbi:uncharacterized protein LOC130657616 [Hydractinia symbiolongicarpus]|uniref:uncharacterized protein LOC130657616 n=1 Tax=Hydractinia symbiolongicarpus TaxID=13093 RepID=UPI00254AEFB6|nr:uncharacterized protein LOC130657616 [Hydractinia symbiolongicarpus]
MEMREATDRKEEEWVYETVVHPNVKHGAQVSNKKCVPHVSRTSIVLMILLILMLMAFALIIILSVKEIISTESKELRNKQYSLVNTISTKMQSLNSKVSTISTNLEEQSNQIESLSSKLYYLIYNRTDASLYKAFKKCLWKVGEGTRYSSYSQDVFIKSSVNMNECIKLCVKKSPSYNGAIYRIRDKRCSCLSNMNGRDSDVEYVSCYIR